jgi:hypothetical protein
MGKCEELGDGLFSFNFVINRNVTEWAGAGGCGVADRVEGAALEIRFHSC